MPAKLPPEEAKRRKREIDNAYALKNKEKRRADHKAWQIKNRVKLRATIKAWRAKNRDKVNAYAREYYKTKTPIEQKIKKWESLKKYTSENPDFGKIHYLNNKDKYLAKKRKRDAIKKSLIHDSADLDAIKSFFSQSLSIFEETGIRYEVDHIIPLIHGGWHHQDNLQILPFHLNRRKGHNPFWQHDGYKSWKDVPEYLWPDKLKQQYGEILNAKQEQ